MHRALPLLALLLAAAATAQTAEVRDLDRQIAALDREIADLSDRLDAVHADLRAVRTDEEALDAERVRFQDAIRAYQADAVAYRDESDRVQRQYDDLVRYGGSDADRRAYDRARDRLEDEGRRLEGEARMLNEWTADLDAGYRGHADRVRATAGPGQRLAERRSALRHERDVLAARRARLSRR